MIRALDPNNPKDIIHLENILDKYLADESTKVNPVYMLDDLKVLAIWLNQKFVSVPSSDFIVSARFTDNTIDQIMIGYKIEIAWEKPKAEDTLPYWVLGLWYKTDAIWKSPYDDIHTIEKLMLEHFEKQKYTKGFFVVRAPNKVVKMTDATQVKDYALNIFSQTVPSLKYDFMIEKVFANQSAIDNYKFRALKAIIPKHCLKPIMLMSLDLHHTHRIKNDPFID
jgi:hypothetical protein